MDLLKVLKEIQDDINFVNTDSVSNKECRYLNRAKNSLAMLIADGESRVKAKPLTPEPISSGKTKY